MVSQESMFAFEGKIISYVQDEAPRLIYADYLEENGFETLAKYVREILISGHEGLIAECFRQEGIIHDEFTTELEYKGVMSNVRGELKNFLYNVRRSALRGYDYLSLPPF